MRGGLTVALPKPHPAQQKVLDSKARFKVLMSGRRFGKSLIAQILAIKDIFEGKRVAYLAPSNKYIDGPDGFFQSVLNMLPGQIVKASNKNTLSIELKTGGMIRFFSGEAVENFRGKKFHKVIVDEAAFVPDLESAWYEVIRPTLTDYQGDALFISTPKGKNFFDVLFQKGKNNEPDFESFHFTSYDNPHIPHSEIESAKASLPTGAFNQEWLAIPGEDGQNPFGIDNIRKNVVDEKEFSKKTTVVYGIDLARTHDYTVIIGLDEDGMITHFERFTQISTQMIVHRIKALPERTLKVVDATGIGGVIFDVLQETVNNVEGFVFTSKSKQEIVYALIKAVEEGSVSYNKITADEMSVFVCKYTGMSEKFEAASGYHDDCVCALAIANHYRKFFRKISSWKLYTA